VYGAAALAMTVEGLDGFFKLRKDRKFAAARSSIVVPELFQVSGIRKFQEAFDGSLALGQVLKKLDAEAAQDKLRNRQVVYLLVNTHLIAEAAQ
jgi:hypothetical protein